ncbi:hypothetical protein CP978_21155 [Streptomyces nodosus]|uniref:Lipoprotein n=1 Tax=Streptomyces nodosus TaxID=40318 RepID=A0A0B5DP33_9ACTN|nr:hypothetical protein SNOD_20840 [Streptomyces nodosus]QEV40725.1 hypothetical protein CP978_21155 [Streptomyces nodosus]
MVVRVLGLLAGLALVVSCAPGGGSARGAPVVRVSGVSGADPVSGDPASGSPASGDPGSGHGRDGGEEGAARPPGPSGPSPEVASPTAAPARERPASGSPAPGPSASGGARVPGPDLSRPSTSPAAPFTAATTPTARATTPSGPSPEPGRAVLSIGDWSASVARGGQDEVDACRDAVQWAGPEIGDEDGYELRTLVVVGHDYCRGFDRFATLPVGSTVTLTTTRGSWTYRVYAHYITPGRGAPAAGLYWGDLTLQSCVGPDTGFSYLMRV